MGCLGRIAQLLLVVSFFGILWNIPGVMESPTMPWEDKAFFIGLGLFVELLMIGVALLMEFHQRSMERSMLDRLLSHRR